MNSISIGWKKQLPGTSDISTKKTHSHKRPVRKVPPPKQQETLQKIEPHVPYTVQRDKQFVENHPYTPLATRYFTPKPTNSPTNVIQVYNDRRLCSVRAAIVTFVIILILIIAAGTSVGIVFAAISSQNSSGTENNNQNSLSTIPTELLTSSISIGSQTGLPCSGYIQINDPTRNFSYVLTSSSCDKGELFNTSNGGSWIRFVGNGGTTMPLSSPGLNHCGAFLSSWYNDTLPTTMNVITNGTVCFETHVSECGYAIDVSVVYCPGNYYVYFLPPIGICNARYCTA